MKLLARRSTPAPGWNREVVAIYPRRSDVPREVWRDLFASARGEIAVLVYAGMFLAEDDELMGILARKAAAGVRVQILLGDPGSRQVADRGDDEGINGEMAALSDAALARHRELLEPRGAQVRLHQTVLYTSMYLADDEMLVNQHVFGVHAEDAPVMHLRQGDGLLFGTYRKAVQQVWDGATAPDAASQ